MHVRVHVYVCVCMPAFLRPSLPPSISPPLFQRPPFLEVNMCVLYLVLYPLEVNMCSIFSTLCGDIPLKLMCVLYLVLYMETSP